MPLSVKAVAFPVAQRRWLLHAWRIGEAEKPAESGLGGVQGFVQGIPDRIIGTAQTQWSNLSEAKEGTFKNWLYKCALSIDRAAPLSLPTSWSMCAI